MQNLFGDCSQKYNDNSVEESIRETNEKARNTQENEEESKDKNQGQE